MKASSRAVPLRPQDDFGRPRVHPTYARLLCLMLRGAGIEVEPLLASAGLSGPRLAVQTQMMEFERLLPLIRAALAVGPQPACALGLGLSLGQRTELSAHGALGYAVVSSPDLRQALRTVARFAGLRNELLRFDLHAMAGGGLALHCVERADLADARGFVLGMVLGTMLRLIDTVLGQRLEGLLIELPFECLAHPHAESLLQGCFSGTVQGSASGLRLCFSETLLGQACLTADPRAHQVAWQDCERELEEQGSALGPWSLRVQALLQKRRPPDPYPSLLELAESCHVSGRTLIRRLRCEGSSYQRLLDGLRQEQVLQVLRQGQLSNEQLAYELGFADASNFSRTVRKWFGATPSALRARLRG